MAKEHIGAGTEVQAGTYRCNACANEHVCEEDGKKLPLCCICDSASWRSSRAGSAKPQDQKKA